MPTFKMIALSNPVEGAEVEFNQWYNQQHLKDVSAIPEVTSANLFRFAAGDNRWQYLAIYEAEADDPNAVVAEVVRRAGTPLMPTSPALDAKSVFFGVFGADSET